MRCTHPSSQALRSVVNMSEKLPSATSLKTAVSRVVLPAHAWAGRVLLSAKFKMCPNASSFRTVVVPILVFLAG